MKYLLIILAVIAAIAAVGYFYIKNISDSLTFGAVKFVGGDIKSIFDGTGFAAVKLSQNIDNKGSLSIPVSGLYVELYHKGNLIGKSASPNTDFTIPSNGNITISQTMTFDISKGLSIAANILTKTPITFDYIIRAKLFGFYPFTYKGNFVY